MSTHSSPLSKAITNDDSLDNNLEETLVIKTNTGLPIDSSELHIKQNNIINKDESSSSSTPLHINNELPKSPSVSSVNSQKQKQHTPTSNSPNIASSEIIPTTTTTEKKRSFLFQHKSGRNKPRSFSLSFKNSSHSRINSTSPNLSSSSLSQLNHSPNNSTLNNSSSLSSVSTSSNSLSSIKPVIHQSEPSLCPESVINSQPLRSEVSTGSLRPNKSESHLNLLSPASSQQSQTSQHHHHHHLFFYSLDRHHSRQSSNSSNPSLNNSNYTPSLAIPPHSTTSSVQVINQDNSNSTSSSSISNNPNMLRKASSRSTINMPYGKSTSKDDYNSSSPIPMGMSIDDYEIGAQIGNGSSAVVYVAKYIPSQKTVCLKVIDLDMFERNQIDGLRKEIQIMSLCKHPNLLTVYGSFVHESKLYIVTPLLSAGSCLNIMKYAYPDGFEEVVIATILKQALLGLEYLHKNGLIHRDVKAGNLLMSEEGLVQLADFGVSSSLMETGERKGLRKTFVGTPCWMAPEVMEQSGYDYKADIWSFGITALEMATGRAPFAKYPPIKVLMLTIENEPPTLDRDQCRHKYSRTFKEMIDLCLNKDPSKRPSAEKLLQHPFFKQAKKKSYLVQSILHNVPSIQMRPLKVVKPKEVENEGIKWDFDSDDEDEKSNKVVKFASSSSSNSINNIPTISSSNNSLHASSSCSVATDAPPLTPIKEDIPSINKKSDLSINNNNNNNTNTNININANSTLNNTIKNTQSTLSSENTNDTSTQSPPKYYMQKNSSSELGFHSLPRSKGRFIIDSGDNAVHCESPASINTNSINSLNRGNSLFTNNTLNSNSVLDNTTQLKFPNGTKTMLGRHLSLADKNGSFNNDNLIIEKRSRFEVSHPQSSSAIEPKPSRFIVMEGNGNTFTERRSRVLEVTSEPPSRHSSNGSISSSNNSINSNSYANIVNSNSEVDVNGIKGINKKIEILMQNSEHQNKLLEQIQSCINQNKFIARNSIYNTSEESNQVLTSAESLMDRLNSVLKELDFLKMENKLLKQNIEKANKLNGQLNQKLISLEQENALLLQKRSQQFQ